MPKRPRTRDSAESNSSMSRSSHVAARIFPPADAAAPALPPKNPSTLSFSLQPPQSSTSPLPRSHSRRPASPSSSSATYHERRECATDSGPSYFDTSCSGPELGSQQHRQDAASATARDSPSHRARLFVHGLQTFVGGLQMSQPKKSSASAAPSRQQQQQQQAEQHQQQAPQQPQHSGRDECERQRAFIPDPTAPSHGLVPTNEAFLVPAMSLRTTNEPAKSSPGVSPGWHVGSMGMRGWSTQRMSDEEGYVPLASFPGGRRPRHLENMLASARREDVSTSSSSSSSGCSSEKTRTSSANEGGSATTAGKAPVAITRDDRQIANHPASLHLLPMSQGGATLPPMKSTPIIADSATVNEAAGVLGWTREVAPPTPLAPAPRTPQCALHNLEVLDTLGTGTFGRVLLVRDRSMSRQRRDAYFALKVLRKSEIVKLKQVQHIESERAILSRIEHPFIVNLHRTFQDSLNCYMLMEYVIGGEIFSHLRRAGRFSVDVTRFYTATLLLAIRHLHSRNIVYRDLKPENLLLDETGYIKMTDFGFAKHLCDERTWTLCGTPEYLAPEIIESKGHGRAADYWALGVLMFEMICGHPPYFGSDAFATYEKILAGDLRFPAHVDADTKHLITSLLEPDVSKRMGNLAGGAEDMMNHRWFLGVDWSALEAKRIAAPIVPGNLPPGDTSMFQKYSTVDLKTMPGLASGHSHAASAYNPQKERGSYDHLFGEF